jgi:hypothetical protein
LLRLSMKILTAEQMRRIDRLTAERAGISTWTLMENAGHQHREGDPTLSASASCAEKGITAAMVW